MRFSAEEVIQLLKLTPLPFEGGYYRRTYQAQGKIEQSVLHQTPHFFSTAIYYLVTHENFSALHRLPQDEVFHFYLGDAVQMWQLDNKGCETTLLLGHDLRRGEVPQVVAPGGVWQGVRVVPGGKWALLGATVAPGYEPADFELASRERLLAQFPQHREKILDYTRAIPS